MRPPIDAALSGAARRWDDVPAEHIADGIERQMIVGEKLMVCRLRFRPHVETAVHSHPHEQITMIEKGRVQFTIAGKVSVVHQGDVLHFAPGVAHGATTLDEEVVLIDIFTPLREDFLPRQDP